jgi:hypothetical protein
VKNWFQSLLFKCDLYRYITGGGTSVVSVAGGAPIRVSARVAAVALLYGDRCKAAHAEVAAAERRRRDIHASLADFAASTSSPRAADVDSGGDRAARFADCFPVADVETLLPLTPLLPPTNNYGCSAAFVAQALPICAALLASSSGPPSSSSVMLRRGLPSALLSGGLAALGPPSVQATARGLIVSLASARSSSSSPSASSSRDEICDGIRRRVSQALEGRVTPTPDTLAALADDCRLLAKLAQSVQLDGDDDHVDDGAAAAVDDPFAAGTVAGTVVAAAAASDATIDVGSLLAEDLSRLAALDIGGSGNGPGASRPPLGPSGTIRKVGGSIPVGGGSGSSSRDSRRAAGVVEIPGPVKLLLELAFQALAAGGSADAVLCECLLLPALRALRGPTADPAVCRGAAARALLALAPPPPTDRPLLTNADVAAREPSKSAPPADVAARAPSTSAAPAASQRAAAVRLGRAWRDAAARNRRRAVLAGFGSAVSVDTSSLVTGERDHEQEQLANAAEELDCDDLSAVRGAASWAVQLLLAPGSGDVRAEAAALIRHVAADGELQRFAVLATLAATLPRACEAAARASALSPSPECSVAAVAGSGAAGSAVADDFFDLLASMLHEDRPADAAVARRFLVARGALGVCTEELTREAARLREADRRGGADPDAGAVLGRLAELLACLVTRGGGDASQSTEEEEAAAVAAVLLRQEGSLAAVLGAALAAKSLVGARTVATCAAEQELTALVFRVAAAHEAAHAALVAAAVAEARRTGPAPLVILSNNSCSDDRDDAPLGGPAPALALPPAPAGHVLAALVRLLLPDTGAAEVSYPLRLVKSATQEEFIRGHMTKNPYSSLEVGATIRDVKNFICASLDMHGLCDDDYGMELLVAGRIMSLDLPIGDVYEHVWQKALNDGDAAAREDDAANNGGGGGGGRLRHDDDDDDDDDEDYEEALRGGGGGGGGGDSPPMVVTYRLQGLDGEATEEMVDSIDAGGGDEADPEEEFAITALIREGDGLAALLSLVPLLSEAGATGTAAAAVASTTSAAAGSRTADVDAQTLSLGLLTASRTETGALLMRLLGAAAELRLNRRALLAAGALPVLLREASGIFSVDEEAARERGNELLLLVERLLQEEAAVAEEEVGGNNAVAAAGAGAAEKKPTPGGLSRSLSSQIIESASDSPPSQPTTTATTFASVTAATPPPPPPPTAPPAPALDDKSDAAVQVRVFLGKLAELTSAGTRRAADTLARVLPRLATHDSAATEALAGHVAASVARLPDLDKLAAGLPGAEILSLELSCCALVTEGIPDDATGTRLKSRLLARGALSAVTSYLLDVAFAAEGARERDKASAAWSEACARPALPPALATLQGLVKSHAASAAAAAAATAAAATAGGGGGGGSLLQLLHALESTTEHGVGTLSENVLEALEAADADAANAIATLRRATRAASMQKAMERREKMLREMGLTRLSPVPAGVSGSPGAGGYGSPGAGALGSSPLGSPSPGGGGYLSAAAAASPTSSHGGMAIGMGTSPGMGTGMDMMGTSPGMGTGMMGTPPGMGMGTGTGMGMGMSPGRMGLGMSPGSHDILTVAVSPSSIAGFEDIADEEDDAEVELYKFANSV